MIKVLISLSESAYKEMCENGIEYVDYDIKQMMREGTTLPKGHGALKDATTLKKMFEDKEGDDFTAFHFYEAIDECPTIIEADEEGAEE